LIEHRQVTLADDAVASAAGPPENARPRSVFRNVVASYGGLFAHALLGFAVTPLLLRGLGTEAFGALVVVQSLATYIAISELGVGTATVRRVAAVKATGRDDELDIVATASIALWLAAAAGGILMLFGLTLSLEYFLHEGGPELTTARWALVLLGGAQIVALFFNVYTALLFGSGRSDLLTITGISVAALGSILQVLAALALNDLVWVAAASAAATVMTTAAIRYVARRKLPPVHISRRNFRSDVARRILSSGWRNAVIAIAAVVAISSDVLIVSAIISLSAAASYGLAARAVGLLRAIATRGTEVLVPSYAHHGALDDNTRLYVILRESTIASWLLAIPASVAIIGFAPGLLDLWLHDVPGGTDDVLRVLSLTVVAAVPGSNIFTLLSGIDRLDFLVIALSVGAVANLAMSIGFTFWLGVVGPALGTLVVLVVLDFIILPMYACRLVNVEKTRLFRDCAWLLGPAAAAGLVAGSLSPLALEPAAAVAASLLTVAAFYAAAIPLAGADRRARYGRLLRRTDRDPEDRQSREDPDK
jgi:O-antigen/teichoic acid export membrane protein